MITILFIVFVIAMAYTFSATGPAMRKNKKTPASGHAGGPRTKVSIRPVDKGDMLRCHNCGCFFPESRVVTRVIEGHILQFCTANCRENFRYP